MTEADTLAETGSPAFLELTRSLAGSVYATEKAAEMAR
jgi:hypothetical protein